MFCGYCEAYLYGESGTSHTGNVHHYYKCVSVKKKRTECHKKSVRKEWIEDLVVSETMKMVMDDKAIEAIVSMLMDLLDRENVNLPLYEQQLREADTAIQNLLNAIQQGILTKSTKGRLEELEAAKEDLEAKIAREKLAKPKVSAEFMTFWLHRFRKLDVRQKSHRKMLIDTFINAIFLYDDKMVITFNYKEGTTTITFDDLKTALTDQKIGSDLDCLGSPRKQLQSCFFFCVLGQKTAAFDQIHDQITHFYVLPSAALELPCFPQKCPWGRFATLCNAILRPASSQMVVIWHRRQLLILQGIPRLFPFLFPVLSHPSG